MLTKGLSDFNSFLDQNRDIISISTAGILFLFGDQSKRLSHECDAYRYLIFYHKVHAITLKEEDIHAKWYITTLAFVRHHEWRRM